MKTRVIQDEPDEGTARRPDEPNAAEQSEPPDQPAEPAQQAHSHRPTRTDEE